MKICVPTQDNSGIEGPVEQHFGKAPTYTIMDTETGEIHVIPNESNHMGGAGLPPEYLFKNGVETMLCSGIGQKALHMFESYGVQVFVGAKGTVKETMTAWETGLLKRATVENTCSEHGHDHAHHH
ncbi:MAG TPA: dinitrogenase iron-molybdenum cofactor biosynthesis protein [Methanosarcina sp.]|nr:dinitrogenase iron-molybdenum cofactor biosynthesis protein [Methanosarcina sp.]